MKSLNQQKKDAEKLVEKINKTYKVGFKMPVRQDDGTIEEWTVRSEASVTYCAAVIWCVEHRSAYDARRVIFPKQQKA